MILWILSRVRRQRDEKKCPTIAVHNRSDIAVSHCEFIYFAFSLWIVCVTFFEYTLADGSVKICFQFNSLRIIDLVWNVFLMKFIQFLNTHTYTTHTLHNSTEIHTHICFGQTSFKTAMRCEQPRTTLERATSTV